MYKTPRLGGHVCMARIVKMVPFSCPILMLRNSMRVSMHGLCCEDDKMGFMFKAIVVPQILHVKPL